MTDRDQATRAIEAILLVADQPVPSGLLADLVDLTVPDVDALCREISAGYDIDGRGFILAKVAGGWRFQTHPDLAPYVERFVLEGQSARLSAAALETLAIVAYKQPISRAQVSAIRGVNVDAVMRTLEQRGYIVEVDRDPGPGQAVLFGTSSVLLEKLGLDRIEDLPPLSEFVPGPDIVEALEQGLRPDAPGPRDLGREPVTPGGAAPSDGPTTPDATASPDEPATPDESGTEHDDVLGRLDETTARLDALVEQVRDRLAATEAAVAEADADAEDEADADTEGEPDGRADAGPGEGSEPAEPVDAVRE